MFARKHEEDNFPHSFQPVASLSPHRGKVAGEKACSELVGNFRGVGHSVSKLFLS